MEVIQMSFFLSILFTFAIVNNAVTVYKDVRGNRYCELGLLYCGEGEGEIYSTIGVSDCPAECWDNLRLGLLAREYNASFVWRNGPRYWTMDGIVGCADATPVVQLQCMFMKQVANIPLSANDCRGGSHPPYVPQSVERNTVWVYAPRRPIYQLISSDGSIYVMQSFTTMADPTLSEMKLPMLGSVLTLPSGWSYRVTSSNQLVYVQARDGYAVVVQDNLLNTYQLWIQEQGTTNYQPSSSSSSSSPSSSSSSWSSSMSSWVQNLINSGTTSGGSTSNSNGNSPWSGGMTCDNPPIMYPGVGDMNSNTNSNMNNNNPMTGPSYWMISITVVAIAGGLMVVFFLMT